MSFGIRNIAELAGVSASTVSRILNKPEYQCSAELREKVLQIAFEHDYMPNINARNLRKGIVQPPLQRHIRCFLARATLESVGSNKFFPTFLRAIEQEVISHDCLLDTIYDMLSTDSLLSNVPNPENTVLIVLGRTANNTLIRKINTVYPHVVFTNLQRIDAPICQVVSDSAIAADKALSYLFSLGHRQIGYVGETTRERRYKGYLNFLERHHLPVQDELIFNCNFLGYEDGNKAAMQLFVRSYRPTAVFCANDLTTVGLMDGLASLGIRVPEDISVVSIDNTELAELTSPMLTSIDIPIKELAHFSIELALKKIDGSLKNNVTIDLACELVIRESCRKI